MIAAERANDSWQPRHAADAFGGFQVIREVARGGMATVYLAQKSRHSVLRQLAAIKLIHRHLSHEPDFVDMFLDEAKIVSSIDHPNVCRVLDFGKAGDAYYLAMDYVMGETWAQVITRMVAAGEPLNMIRAMLAHVIAQACEGLHAAHEAQDAGGRPLRIVHRDVSPQNIMVGYDGSVRVVDFGIASAVNRLHVTRDGQVKGRLSYMAPEQMRAKRIDRRADVWSLGVILWEGFAQERLFRKERDAETILAVTEAPIPSLKDRAQGVPAPIQQIVSRALSREPDGRFATARELGLALSQRGTQAFGSVTMANASDIMHRLFAREIEAKRELLRDAWDGASEASSGISEVQIDTPELPDTRAVRVSMIRTSNVHRGDIGGAIVFTAVLLMALAFFLLTPETTLDPEVVSTGVQSEPLSTDPEPSDFGDPGLFKAVIDWIRGTARR